MSDKNLIEVKKGDNGQRIERWLKKNAPHIPYTLIQKLMRKGAIKVDGKKVKVGFVLQAGQQVRIPQVEDRAQKKGDAPQKRTYSNEDVEKYITSNIIYEDKKLLAINKAPGLPAQGGSGVKISVDDLLPYVGEGDCKLVHRIDKDTSGVMLLGKGREYAAEMAKRFKDKNVGKIYWAIIVGRPDAKEGKIDMPLGKVAGIDKIEKAVIDESEEGKKAVTFFRIIDTASDTLSWVELRPVTGRMHQLRVHMAAIGHPIMGDGKYGGKTAFIHGLSNSMHLHARAIILPDYLKNNVRGKRDLEIKADLPNHMKKTFSMFGFTEE